MMAIWCKKCNKPNPKTHEEFMMFFFDRWCECKPVKKKPKKQKG
jgi:hypothetical protein